MYRALVLICAVWAAVGVAAAQVAAKDTMPIGGWYETEPGDSESFYYVSLSLDSQVSGYCDEPAAAQEQTRPYIDFDYEAFPQRTQNYFHFEEVLGSKHLTPAAARARTHSPLHQYANTYQQNKYFTPANEISSSKKLLIEGMFFEPNEIK